MFYSIKDDLGTGFSVKSSYSYASNYNFPPFQQQISSCSASGIYPFKGAPDLLFAHKRATDVSQLMSGDDIELFDLKQGYLAMPKVPIADLPNVAGQFLAGLRFLSAASPSWLTKQYPPM